MSNLKDKIFLYTVVFIFLAISTLLLIAPSVKSVVYLISSLFIVGMGLFSREIFFLNRILLIQIIAAISMVFFADVQIRALIDLPWIGTVTLQPWMGITITILLVGFFIHAMSRMNGIEGMVIGLVVEALITLIFLTGLSDSMLWLIIIFSILLFIIMVYNQSFHPVFNKEFMDESSAMFLGYSLVWSVISYSQVTETGELFFRFVTGLYVLGLPLIDLVINLFRFARKKTTDFLSFSQRADLKLISKTHLHRVLLRAGLGGRNILYLVLFLGGSINMLGIFMHVMHVPDIVQLIIWLSIILGYDWFMRRSFRVIRWVRTFKFS